MGHVKDYYPYSYLGNTPIKEGVSPELVQVAVKNHYVKALINLLIKKFIL